MGHQSKKKMKKKITLIGSIDLSLAVLKIILNFCDERKRRRRCEEKRKKPFLGNQFTTKIKFLAKKKVKWIYKALSSSNLSNVIRHLMWTYKLMSESRP